MAWLTYLLAQHPDVVARLRAEADAVLGNVPDTDAPVAAFRSMPYALQVVQEALRLYPPAWAMSRMALNDDQIGPYRIPKGDTVIVSPYLLHHDPANWPDPDRFDPDRFAEGRDKDRPTYAYLPFGGGPRLCIGNQFALMEMQILLTFFVRTFDFHLANTAAIKPKPLITLRPNRPILVRLSLRN
jgi:cytochrome P450